jgi:hypothetical protein
VDELSFRCGQMSVRREAANVLPIIVGTGWVGAALVSSSTAHEVDIEAQQRATIDANHLVMDARGGPHPACGILRTLLKPLLGFKGRIEIPFEC